MMKFINNLIDKFLGLNISKKRQFKTVYQGKNSKLIVGAGANVTINAAAKKSISEVKTSVENLVKETNGETDKLLEYIKNNGTQIYYVQGADKALALVKEVEGIIFEQKGLKALYLSLITGNGFKFHTEPMFIMRKGKIDKYYFLHHFYRWYSMKFGLPGFDYESQKKFKKYLMFNSKEDTKKLNIEDILDIEEAIARDQEATSFVLEYTKQKDGAKNVINKIKNDGGANI